MHQSLYRKYRPQTFDDVVGQKVIIKSLKNVILKNKISHAYLFTGPRGTGKTSVAKILAKTVNCVNLTDTSPCNECVSCTQINQKQTVDVIEIDAASNNGVDEIRELKSKVSLVPTVGKYKIYIIDEVHMLTIGAFNALLKTLEEPPAHIIFILATTEPHKIPETILSRCQKFDFKRIDDKSMDKRLKYICKSEKIDIEDQALEEIIRFSSGGMRDSISLLEQAQVYSDSIIKLDDVHEINGTLPQSQLKELIENIIDKNLVEVFKLLEKYDEQGKNLIKLVEEIILFFKNIVILKNTNSYIAENISREIYNDIITKISIEEAFQNISKIYNYLNKMKNYSNPKLVFELLMISLVSNEGEENNNYKNNDSNIERKMTVINNQTNDDNQILKEPIKKEKTDIINNDNIHLTTDTQSVQNQELINKIKHIRVNNTFTNASRAILNQIKTDVELSRKYILDANFGKIASLLIDAEITAASDKNIVFVYTRNSMTINFNSNILKIESFIPKIFDKEYNVIALNKDEWSKYRKEYKSKTKKYTYIDEDKSIKDFLQDQIKGKVIKDEIHNLFGDVIEYNTKKEGIK
ncbi:MAG TPA: DNA polymerase III subunit gamma/tau [Mollicutes bacterium]|nr:DNA polymerase III subunit gamma/tau [Mollicutes bacterium]